MHTVLDLPACSARPSETRTSSPVRQTENDKSNQQTATYQADKAGQSDEVDLESIKAAVRTILKAVGEDPDREGLQETPRRVAKMYAEIFAGLHLDPARHLHVTFTEEYDELILVRDIPFTSMCEHHLLPFTGVAHVGYIPQGHVTGLSKLARVVEEVARRPQVQERMTHKIAELIETELQTIGVGVVIQAEHSCMSIRGVKKHGSSTITSALRGTLKTSLSSRNEFLSLIDARSRDYTPRTKSIQP